MTSLRTGLLRSAAAAGMAIATLTIAVAPASAGGLNNRLVAGFQSRAGCLTTKLCVVGGYNSKGIGDIVAVRNGLPGHVSTVKGTQGIDWISCPNATGCVAMARTSNDVGTEFLTINSAGVVARSQRVSLPSGVLLGRIACQTVTSCEVAGTQVFTHPISVEVGTWVDGKLTLHRVGVPSKSTDTIVEGLGCFKTTCDVVGYLLEKGSTVGLSISVTSGTHAKLHTVGHDALYGIACISATRCYADGFGSNGGLIVTLANGTASTTVSSKAVLYDIACNGTSCTAVGKKTAPPGSSNPYWGQVLSVASGTIRSTQMVPQSAGYDGVGRVGNLFCAIGSSQNFGSEVTTG